MKSLVTQSRGDDGHRAAWRADAEHGHHMRISVRGIRAFSKGAIHPVAEDVEAVFPRLGRCDRVMHFDVPRPCGDGLLGDTQVLDNSVGNQRDGSCFRRAIGLAKDDLYGGVAPERDRGSQTDKDRKPRQDSVYHQGHPINPNVEGCGKAVGILPTSHFDRSALEWDVDLSDTLLAGKIRLRCEPTASTISAHVPQAVPGTNFAVSGVCVNDLT